MALLLENSEALWTDLDSHNRGAFGRRQDNKGCIIGKLLYSGGHRSVQVTCMP